MCACSGSHKGPKRELEGIESLVAVVTGSCEPSAMNVGV